MKSACPCCGAPVETKWPLVDINTNRISWGQRTAKVTPRGAEILTVLIENGRRYATLDYLTSRIWGQAEADLPDDTRSTLSAHITHLRRVLEPMGLTIDVSYGRGWRLERVGETQYAALKRSPANAQ